MLKTLRVILKKPRKSWISCTPPLQYWLSERPSEMLKFLKIVQEDFDNTCKKSYWLRSPSFFKNIITIRGGTSPLGALSVGNSNSKVPKIQLVMAESFENQTEKVENIDITDGKVFSILLIDFAIPYRPFFRRP